MLKHDLLKKSWLILFGLMMWGMASAQVNWIVEGNNVTLHNARTGTSPSGPIGVHSNRGNATNITYIDLGENRELTSITVIAHAGNGENGRWFIGRNTFLYHTFANCKQCTSECYGKL